MRFLDFSTTALIFWPLFDQQKVAEQVRRLFNEGLWVARNHLFRTNHTRYNKKIPAID